MRSTPLVIPRRLALAALAAAALAAPSCIISSHSDQEISGQYVSPTTLTRIEPGKNQDYVLALLGEPSSRNDFPDGSSIWKWSYVERKVRSGALIFVLDADSKVEERHMTYVEFGPDGTVAKAWQD